jgi:hypothetical protein
LSLSPQQGWLHRVRIGRKKRESLNVRVRVRCEEAHDFVRTEPVDNCFFERNCSLAVPCSVHRRCQADDFACHNDSGTRTVSAAATVSNSRPPKKGNRHDVKFSRTRSMSIRCADPPTQRFEVHRDRSTPLRDTQFSAGGSNAPPTGRGRHPRGRAGTSPAGRTCRRAGSSRRSMSR